MIIMKMSTIISTMMSSNRHRIRTITMHTMMNTTAMRVVKRLLKNHSIRRVEAGTTGRLHLPSTVPIIQITATRTRLSQHSTISKQLIQRTMHQINTSSRPVVMPMTLEPRHAAMVCKDRITIPSKRDQVEPRKIPTMTLHNQDINHKAVPSLSGEEAKEEVTVAIAGDITSSTIITINSILTTTIITTTEFFRQ